MGGEAIDKYGDPLPQHELDKCLAADSVLLGAVGGPKWDGVPGDKRPEKGLLRIRSRHGPVLQPAPGQDCSRSWLGASPLQARDIVAKGIDFMVGAGADRRRVLRRAQDRDAGKRRAAGRQMSMPYCRARDRADSAAWALRRPMKRHKKLSLRG